LPLVYNDGKKVEKEKFFYTNQELVKKFGATTTDSIIAAGSWLYKGTLYNDKLIVLELILLTPKKLKIFSRSIKKI